MSKSHANDTDKMSFNVTYDKRADVLYLNSKVGGGADSRLDKLGILWMYDDDGDLVGATILNFYDRWFSNPTDLAEKLSKRFHLPVPQTNTVLDKAFSLHGTH